ncbi:hypothetical protein JJD41_06840 [Oxynema sp. CENA135]|uniref:hypothetical protein n=1 Tax=Oxynema sp. CENA135 TaxID=984206 RepID=UPI00190A866E|nr:hypothetical protein [Oxynema sp. CENA135]MBK4729584.1 hypothetical protein [Oxynema sp. CENA135]
MSANSRLGSSVRKGFGRIGTQHAIVENQNRAIALGERAPLPCRWSSRIPLQF